MKAYCLDTSGLSNPLGSMPEDIHRSLWKKVAALVQSGKVAVTTEIFEELTHINGDIGDCLRASKSALQLEVGDEGWDFITYLEHTNRMQDDHKTVISEFNSGQKGTVGLTDLSIIALGRTLGLPVISMELHKPPGSKWQRIPNVCATEGVEHLTFNDFLRRERIVV